MTLPPLSKLVFIRPFGSGSPLRSATEIYAAARLDAQVLEDRVVLPVLHDEDTGRNLSNTTPERREFFATGGKYGEYLLRKRTDAPEGYLQQDAYLPAIGALPIAVQLQVFR